MSCTEENLLGLVQHLSQKDLATIVTELYKSNKKLKVDILKIVEEKCVGASSLLKDESKNISDFISYLSPVLVRSDKLYNALLYKKALTIAYFILEEYSLDFKEFSEQWEGKEFIQKVDKQITKCLEKCKLNDEEKKTYREKGLKCTRDLKKYKIKWTFTEKLQ